MHENLFNEVIRITASQLAYYLTLCYREHSGKIPSVMHVFFKKEKHSQLYFLAGHSLSIIALKMVFTGNRSRVA